MNNVKEKLGSNRTKGPPEPSERQKALRIFSELIDLSLDVVFTHGPQLFVKLG